jgi:hypothetical protein
MRFGALKARASLNCMPGLDTSHGPWPVDDVQPQSHAGITVRTMSNNIWRCFVAEIQ